ncbi:MAG: DUF721 domain-containing protein [Thermodesulfobacteriota bacterium]
MKKKDFDSLPQFLTGYMKERGWQEQLELHSVFLRWPEIADQPTASHAMPVKIIKKVLWVEVENSSWLQQLQYQKQFLLERCNRAVKGTAFADIRFVLAVEKDSREPEKKAGVSFQSPPDNKRQAFARQLEGIEDEEIREALMRLWYLSHACQRHE